MVITIYGIRNCQTMKKARAWLDGHGLPYRFHDYHESGIDADVLARWCAQLGWEALLNRSGTTFRRLPEAQKTALNERKAIALMLSQPSMIKRPVLQVDKRLLVGFRPELYERSLRNGPAMREPA